MVHLRNALPLGLLTALLLPAADAPKPKVPALGGPQHGTCRHLAFRCDEDQRA
jgi:hypothetical protein